MDRDTHQHRQRMRRDVVWRDWMSCCVSEIRIVLNLQQCFRKCAVRLVHPDELCPLWKRLATDFEIRSFFRKNGVHAAPHKNTHQGCRRWSRFDQESEELTGSSRPHSVFTDCIKPRQPLFAICRRMVQQQERRCGHVLRDVAEAPLTTGPHWLKLRRLFLRIVTLARTEVFQLQRDGTGDPCRRSFRKNARTGMVMRIRARRTPRIVRRVCRDSLEALLAHLAGDPVSELRVSSNDRFGDVWFNRRHVRRQKESRAVSALLMYVVNDLRM